MKNILAVSWITDNYRSIVNSENLEKSLNFFNPNIKLKIFDTADTINAINTHRWINNYWMKPVACLPYANNYDSIINLDGDILITGKLDDIENSTEDIICVRNMNSQGKAGAHNWGNTITLHNKKISAMDYANAGLVASNSKTFWSDWLDFNSFLIKNKLEGLVDEQGSLNYMFHSGKYTTKFLDGPGIKKSYGLSNAWGTGDNHWESWSQIYIKNNKLYLQDPIEGEIEIKVLHQAGGGLAAQLNHKYGGFRNWLRTILTDDVNDYIDIITK